MKDKINQRYSYQSEKYNQKYAIWYCDLYNQWFVGLKKEIGLCQGYAYIDSTSDCLVCNGEFGWRLVQKNVMEYGWNLSPVSVACEKKGTFSYTKIHTINFLDRQYLIFAEYRERVLIAAGAGINPTEVIDIVTPTNICDMKGSFERWAATGGIVDNQILICGGKSASGGRHQNCSSLTNNSVEIDMTTKRYGASSAIFGGKLWVAGKFL